MFCDLDHESRAAALVFFILECHKMKVSYDDVCNVHVPDNNVRYDPGRGILIQLRTRHKLPLV